VRGTDDGAEVVRVFDAVEDDDHPAFGGLFEIGVALGGAESDDALMGGAAGEAVERVAGFEADGDAGLAREIDDLLKAGAACPLGYEDAVERPLAAKGLGDGMDTGEDGH
jgi:hypothetical protein